MHNGHDRATSGFMAGVFGAMIGATIAVILSDKDRRRRLMDVLDGVAERGRKFADEVEGEVEERVDDVRGRLEDRTESAVKQVKKKVAQAN